MFIILICVVVIVVVITSVGIVVVSNPEWILAGGRVLGRTIIFVVCVVSSATSYILITVTHVVSYIKTIACGFAATNLKVPQKMPQNGNEEIGKRIGSAIQTK